MLSMSDENKSVDNDEKSMVENAVEKVKEVAADLVEKAQEVIEEVKEEIQEVKEEIQEAVEEAKEVVAEVVENLTGKDDDDSDSEDNETSDGTSNNSDDDEDDTDVNEIVAAVTITAEDAEVAHDDFDWGRGKRNTSHYSEEETVAYLAGYEETLSTVNAFEIIGGKVTAIRDGDVVLDLNYKSDGLVSLSEFRDTPDLAVGDVVDVYVEEREDKRGQLVLSRRKAKLLKAWDTIKDAHTTGAVVKGTVISKTKGGLIVDTHGLETFLPGSQIDIKPIMDYDAYVGKTMEFKVVKINEAIKNAVVSHKALIESDLEEQRQQIISSLEQGQVLEGLVKNITDFGAFLDLGGVDGLLYITDISWGRISHPSEVLKLNQKINVVVLDFDDNKKRISLGLKQLQPHPWEVLAETVAEGSTVEGKIVNIEDYGAFLEIQPGVEGLIHVSEVTWSNQPINSKEFFKLGDIHSAKVVTIDRDNRKMSLSLKQLQDDPWSKIEEKYPKESRHTGDVKNLTPYGVFVELEEGIGGMVHISDLSWTKRFNHPAEYTKVGTTIDVVILDIDKRSRKLSLGHKQIEENPWDTFENVFPVGSHHEATVIRRDDRGAIVLLPYGLEAYAPIKHIKKDDGTSAEVDEKLMFKVLEFNRDDKRILVSHLRYLDDLKRDADFAERQAKRAEREKARAEIQKQQQKIEKSTLGDMDVFSQLKEQLKETDDDNKDDASA